ncbi:PcfB family protein [Cohnella hongkongensis]|uniref:PcfB family protein n=1 Tax=Cohnella hongkongensis TaxID=178337 RepID=A0ABV9F888_9BACL
MQEDIEQRTIALSVNATKLTGRTLANVLSAALRQIQRGHQKRQTPQGRQSVKKLMNHGVATNSLDLSGNTRLFDRVARKYNVDYAFHKTGPDKYLLFFKAGQADAITACFGEYTKRVLNQSKSKRPSILKQLQTFADKERTKPRQQERTREAVRNER